MESESVARPTPTHPAPSHPVGRSAIPGQSTGEGSWLQRRRDARARKRAEAGRTRIVHRVEMLGANWRIVDYHVDDPDFLAIGPGWPGTSSRSTGGGCPMWRWPGGTRPGSPSR